ncbi:F-box protein At2g26160-like [Spinacia oleracea]|uniref:F-box protein At2g26160-like n=1 Tax=Spinacia oleracea TaxID=3562 RepID=A0ABM3QSK7_SPIOL|nr:F-box protein At2g26160-like [Spinacia oleracea]
MPNGSHTRPRRRLNWSDLPKQVLQSIAKSLGTDIDSLRSFRSVCKKWRQSTAYSVPTSVHKGLLSSSVILLRPRGGSASISTPWMVSVVQIANGITLFFHPFFGTPLISLPKELDFSQFHTSRLSMSHHKADYGEIDNLSALYRPEKLLLTSLKFKVPGTIRLPLLKIVEGSNEQIDDSINFCSFIYSIDWKGNLYKFSIQKSTVSKTLSASAFDEVDVDVMRYRKRLVTPSSLLIRKLYLVVRRKNMFKVYELCDKLWSSWKFVEVQSFGDKDDLVLFVTRDYSFFASAKDFPGCQLSNCIVFSHYAFPAYSNTDLNYPRDGVGIYIYQLGGNNHAFMPISSYPGFPIHLWSPPSCVLQASLSLRREAGKEGGENKQPVDPKLSGWCI